MRVRGLGTDIIECARIASSLERQGTRFLERLFTKKEIAYCERYNESSRHYAGRFAAKEAILKALGTGLSPEISWTDIEVLNDERGKPQASLSPRALPLLEGGALEISISHCEAYATAVAIWMGQ